MVVVKIFLPNSAGYLTLSVSSSLALSKLKLMVFQRVRKKYGANKKKRGSAGAPVRSPRWIQRLMKKSSSDYKLKWHLESDIKGLSAEQLSCVVSNEDVIVDTLTAVRTANDAADVIALVTREIGNDAEAEVVKTYNSESTAADQAPSDVENKSGGKKDLAPNATWTRPIELELLEVSKMDGGTDEDGEIAGRVRTRRTDSSREGWGVATQEGTSNRDAPAGLKIKVAGTSAAASSGSADALSRSTAAPGKVSSEAATTRAASAGGGSSTDQIASRSEQLVRVASGVWKSATKIARQAQNTLIATSAGLGSNKDTGRKRGRASSLWNELFEGSGTENLNVNDYDLPTVGVEESRVDVSDRVDSAFADLQDGLGVVSFDDDLGLGSGGSSTSGSSRVSIGRSFMGSFVMFNDGGSFSEDGPGDNDAVMSDEELVYQFAHTMQEMENIAQTGVDPVTREQLLPEVESAIDEEMLLEWGDVDSDVSQILQQGLGAVIWEANKKKRRTLNLRGMSGSGIIEESGSAAGEGSSSAGIDGSGAGSVVAAAADAAAAAVLSAPVPEHARSKSQKMRQLQTMRDIVEEGKKEAMRDIESAEMFLRSLPEASFDVIKINEMGRHQQRVLRFNEKGILNIKATGTALTRSIMTMVTKSIAAAQGVTATGTGDGEDTGAKDSSSTDELKTGLGAGSVVTVRHGYADVTEVVLCEDSEKLIIKYSNDHDFTYVSPLAPHIVQELNGRLRARRNVLAKRAKAHMTLELQKRIQMEARAAWRTSGKSEIGDDGVDVNEAARGTSSVPASRSISSDPAATAAALAIDRTQGGDARSGKNKIVHDDDDDLARRGSAGWENMKKASFKFQRKSLFNSSSLQASLAEEFAGETGQESGHDGGGEGAPPTTTDLGPTASTNSTGTALPISNKTASAPAARLGSLRGRQIAARTSTLASVTDFFFGQSSDQRLIAAIQRILYDKRTAEGATRRNFLSDKNIADLERNPRTLGRKVRQFIEGLCEYIINNRRAELVKLVPVDPIEQGAVAALSGRGSHSDDDNEDLEMDMDDLNGRYDKVARASSTSSISSMIDSTGRFRRDAILAEILMRAIEDAVLLPRQERIWRCLSTLPAGYDVGRERRVARKLRKLRASRKFTQKTVEILEENRSPRDWQNAVDALSGMHAQETPTAMLSQLFSSAKAVYIEHSRNEEAGGKLLGADDFVPIHIFCVVRAALRRPLLCCHLMWNLCDPDKLQGEAGYYLTVFESALMYILETELEI